MIGSETRVKVVKNKVAPPFKQATFDILYGEGVSRVNELIEMGVLYDVIAKSGAWYSYQGTRIGQGKENVRQYLLENPTMMDEIERQLDEKIAKRGIVSPMPKATVETEAEVE